MPPTTSICQTIFNKELKDSLLFSNKQNQFVWAIECWTLEKQTSKQRTSMEHLEISEISLQNHAVTCFLVL